MPKAYRLNMKKQTNYFYKITMFNKTDPKMLYKTRSMAMKEGIEKYGYNNFNKNTLNGWKIVKFQYNPEDKTKQYDTSIKKLSYNHEIGKWVCNMSKNNKRLLK